MRYSVKPTTEREIVLYELLNNVEVSSTELLIKLGHSAHNNVRFLKYGLLLPIEIKKVSTYTYYYLTDYFKAFQLYEHWLTTRQDRIKRDFDLFDDWINKDLKHIDLAKKYNMNSAHVSHIIEKLIQEGALLLYKNKLAQVTEKL